MKNDHENLLKNLDTKSRVSFVLRDSVVFGGASAFTAMFSLLTFPILTHHYSVSEYGRIDLFGMVTSFIMILCVFGQDSAVMRFFYDSDDRDHRRQVVSQSLVMQLIFSVALVPIPLFFSGWIGPQINSSSDSGLLFRLVLLTAPLQLVYSFACLVSRINFRRGHYVFLTVGTVLIRIVVLLSAIYLFDIGVVPVFVINLVMAAVSAAIGCWFIRDWITWPTSLSVARGMLPYACPLGIIMAISLFLPILQRLIVEHLVGEESLGLYAAGAKVAMLLSVPIAAFNTAWGPFSLSIAREDDVERTYQTILRMLVLLLVPLVLFLDLSSSFILEILATAEYASGAAAVFPLACGLSVIAISSVVSVGLMIEKKVIYRLYAFALYLIGSFIFIVLLGRSFGVVGVAYGTLIGQCILTISLVWFANRISPLRWNILPVLMFFTSTLLVGFLAMRFFGSGTGAIAPLVGAFVIVLSVIVGWVVLLRSDDRHVVREVMSDMLRMGRRSKSA